LAASSGLSDHKSMLWRSASPAKAATQFGNSKFLI
jgi:hypothetical protein